MSAHGTATIRQSRHLVLGLMRTTGRQRLIRHKANGSSDSSKPWPSDAAKMQVEAKSRQLVSLMASSSHALPQNARPQLVAVRLKPYWRNNAIRRGAGTLAPDFFETTHTACRARHKGQGCASVQCYRGASDGFLTLYVLAMNRHTNKETRPVKMTYIEVPFAATDSPPRRAKEAGVFTIQNPNTEMHMRCPC